MIEQTVFNVYNEDIPKYDAENMSELNIVLMLGDDVELTPAEEEMVPTDGSPFCFRCNKSATEVGEYLPEITGELMSPDEFVRELEGTYNVNNDHFCCTECYIAIGMPSSRYGWVAP